MEGREFLGSIETSHLAPGRAISITAGEQGGNSGLRTGISFNLPEHPTGQAVFH